MWREKEKEVEVEVVRVFEKETKGRREMKGSDRVFFFFVSLFFLLFHGALYPFFLFSFSIPRCDARC
jgi:hypothetical protein